jgi:hypothetical protein
MPNESAFASADGPTIFQPLPTDGDNTGGGDNSHSLFSRETFIGTGKRDQVIVGQKLIFSLALVGLF